MKEWEAGHPRGQVVHTRDQLMDLDTESTDQVESMAPARPHGRQTGRLDRAGLRKPVTLN